jgi:peptide subunit release factor 1 (eRF1)
MTLKTEAAPLADVLDRLAAFEPAGAPVLSLYADARAGAHGKDGFEPLVRKELPERARSFRAHSPARESFDRDVEKIAAYLSEEVAPRANGIAIFACAGAGLFETVQIEAPFETTRLFVGAEPHLYPLARVLEQYRRYAAVVTDTNRARIFVFGLRRVVDTTEVTSRKTRRSDVGGWSQMRYQRHTDNFHLGHAKDVVEALARVMREEALDEVVLAGDEVIMPLVREQLPKPLADKVVDVLRLDVRAPEHEVLTATVEALRRHDARTDAEKVQRLLDEARSGGLGVLGARDTLAALQGGQVDELVISAVPSAVRAEEGTATDPEALASELVARARQTAARITFIEEPDLAEELGGVGALLRYRIAPDLATTPPVPPEGVEA